MLKRRCCYRLSWIQIDLTRGTKYEKEIKSLSISDYFTCAIIIGSIIGLVFGEKANVIKPLGDIFINLLFMVVVPLVFFTISSSIASMDSMRRLGKILGSMMTVFIVTGIIASIFMLIFTVAFSPLSSSNFPLEEPEEVEEISFADQLVQTFTVPDFVDLFSRSNMLVLIIFTVLVGLATGLANEQGKVFAKFLTSGSEVFMKLVQIIMYYAPIGLGAYFAALVGEFGTTLLGDYAKAIMIYYPVAILYFFIGFTLYSFIAGGKRGVSAFWKNILGPAVTSLGTGSSVATIPINLQTAKKIGVPKDVRETVIPLGASIHMDGSCLSAMLKIEDIDFAIDIITRQVSRLREISPLWDQGIPAGQQQGAGWLAS